jgi:FkbM family methyltransferase
MIDKIAKKTFSAGFRMYKTRKYSRFKKGHIFSISVGDISFRMTFMDYPLNPAIIERIDGRREPDTAAVIKTLVREGSKVLELGGCYGYFTIIMSKCAGDTGKVVSVEGMPYNYKILRKNLEINGIRNVEAHNFFVAPKAGSVTIREDGIQKKRTRVEGKKMTAFLKDTGFSPDYIFMDIEGSEADVFEDFSHGYLEKNRPVILFETHQSFYKKKDLKWIMSVLDDNNYAYRRIEKNLLCFPK